KHLTPRLHHLSTDKQPLWFTFLEETIIENNIHHSILSNYQPQNIIIGKVRRYFKHSNTISITHWPTKIDTSQSQLYPLFLISCMLCPGCNLNTNHISSAYTIKISATLSTHFY
ncbi:7674_t:CDS:2, partial [Gigaspora margarita]